MLTACVYLDLACLHDNSNYIASYNYNDLYTCTVLIRPYRHAWGTECTLTRVSQNCLTIAQDSNLRRKEPFH